MLDETIFRQAMRLWATGVTVVTSACDSERHGMTVSSFTSVSTIPPVVCISINRQARTHRLIEKSGLFAVTILSEGQEAISETFAGKASEEMDRFQGLSTEIKETGSPVISGGIASFDCRVVGKSEFGSNTVFFGEVLAAEFSESGQPLLYTNRTYQALQK